MKKTVAVYIVAVLGLLSVSVMAGDIDGFVDMEDFAAFAADWQNPLQLEDLAVLADYWLTNYTPMPSLAWWEMEETDGSVVYDSTANAHDLIPTDGFIISDSWIGSMVGNGFLFDGSGERLTHPTLLDDMPDAITITGWLRPDATGMSDTQCWFSKQNADGVGYMFWLTFKMNGTATNVIAASGRSDGEYLGEYFNCNSSVTWEDDTWYHVAFTWDSSGCEIYVDGQPDGSDEMPIMGDVIAGRNPLDLSIGAAADASKLFKGIIDDVRIYDSVLTATEINEIYSSAPELVTYDLIVNNGSGDGSYVYNAAVDIAADAPAAGQEFDVWTGDTAAITDIYDPTTTLVMPTATVNVTATYRPATPHTLTVNSGTGDGSYILGTVVNIAAYGAPAGQTFDVWTGDTAYITNVNDPTTTVTMPEFAVNVTATYRPVYNLTVNSGTGDGSYIENTVVNIAAYGAPAGQMFDSWTGDTAYIANIYDPTTTVTMPEAAVSVTATYRPLPVLTVINGTGDGSYNENTVVIIAADAPPVGQVFDAWTSDSAYIEDMYAPTTTVTMSEWDTTVTATYKTPPVSLDQTVLLEAEGFDDHGGWSLDQQHMDQMGSPYLLAHGINNPVADAMTAVTFPSTGTFHVWVRTRDWVATWKEPYLDSSSVKYANGTPGLFEVIVNGTTLPVTFGNEFRQWHWQYGGTIFINKTNVTVALHDLTGYEGRCDAIVFSKDYTASPPNVDPEMKLWRRDMLDNSGPPEETGHYDLVVVGGGVAGTCAAVSAARQGISVALIQDRPVLGGNNSSEVRVGISGDGNYEPYPLIGTIVDELDTMINGNRGPASFYDDDRKLNVVLAESNIDLYLNCRGNEVEMNGSTIVAVIAENTETGHRLRFTGLTFADCTGDGVIGYIAGADSEMTMSGQGEGTKLGTSNLWRLKTTYPFETFPSCPWALNLTSGSFPIGGFGDWNWESGFYYDSINDGEFIRDWNFRAAYGTWDALNNKMSGYSYYQPEWQAYISGKRESRRLLGDIILTRDDLLDTVEFEDGCFPLSWRIDLHYPHPTYGRNRGFEFDEFISFWDGPVLPQIPYWAPYRCLYSRNIDNLFMAGRNISVTHEALGSVRVQKTTGMMGEIVGMAASLCKEHNTTPRGVYTDHLNSLKDLMSGQN